MKRVSALPLSLLMAGLLASPARAGEPTLTIKIDNLPFKVEVGLVTPVKKADNALIKIFEGSQKGDVDILRRLKHGGNMRSELPSGQFRLEFSGFLMYCEPQLYLRVLDGANPPSRVLFTAYYNKATSKQLEIRNVTYEGAGAFFTVDPATATITVAE